jgi:zinc and cadmium transporter
MLLMSLNLRLYLAAIVFCSLAGGAARLVFSRQPADSQLGPASFAGGILLGVAFFHMIPDVAPILGQSLGLPLVGGFSAIAVLEHFLIVHPHPEHPAEHGQTSHVHIGGAVAIGISFHSMLDGLAVASSYGQAGLGSAVLVAVIAHKIPEAFALATLLLLDHWSKPATLAWLLAYSVTTPVGAILTFDLLRHANLFSVAAAVAFSAGTFLAIAASDILPRIQIQRSYTGRALPLVAFLGGVMLSWLAALVERAL